MLVPEEVETFLAIARFGGLAVAAEALHASQSTVSYRLQSLEHRLDQLLIERARGARRTVLTPAGERFVEVAERWEDLVDEARRIRTRQGLPLRIGAADALNIHLLPHFFRLLADDPSGPRVAVEAGSGPWVCDQIALQHLDMGFVFFDRVHSDLVVDAVARSEMVLLRSQNSSVPVPAGEPVALERLPPEREIRLPWGPDFIAWRQRLPGTEPLAQVGKTYALPPFLRARDTWAIVAAFTADDLAAQSGCSIHPLLDEPPARVIYRVTNRTAQASRSRALEALNAAWEKTVAELDQRSSALKWT